jgi:hypothetical protein
MQFTHPFGALVCFGMTIADMLNVNSSQLREALEAHTLPSCINDNSPPKVEGTKQTDCCYASETSKFRTWTRISTFTARFTLSSANVAGSLLWTWTSTNAWSQDFFWHHTSSSGAPSSDGGNTSCREMSCTAQLIIDASYRREHPVRNANDSKQLSSHLKICGHRQVLVGPCSNG